MSKALLIIDIQMDYFPGGRMELVGSEAAVDRLVPLLFAFRARGLPVVHIQHVSTRQGASFFLPGSPGAEIHPRLAPLPGEEVLVKHFPSSFRGTGLDEVLRARGVESLVVAGMMTHMCVDTTVRAGFDLAWPMVVVGDACATRSLAFGGRMVEAGDVQAAYLAALDGTFAQVLPSASVLGLVSP